LKYYCKICGIVLDIDGKKMYKQYGGYGNMRCPCGKYAFDILPDYETPQQYKERTGKPYPDNCPVWLRVDSGDTADLFLLDNKCGFNLMSHIAAKNFQKSIYYLSTAVIADPPFPPLDNWKPEDINEKRN
jgi:hypothetical protein